MLFAVPTFPGNSKALDGSTLRNDPNELIRNLSNGTQYRRKIIRMRLLNIQEEMLAKYLIKNSSGIRRMRIRNQIREPK